MNQRMKARLSASTVLAIAVMTLAPLTQVSASPVRALTSSAVTVNGSGDFSDLKVTVAQTRNLLDQVVEISWEGATQCATGTGGASKTSTSVSSSGSTSTSTTTGGGTGTTGATGGTTTTDGTGQTTASGDSGQGISTVNGIAVTLPVSSRWGLEQAAMVFAAITLLVVLIAPPLVARRLSAGTKK